MNATLETGRTAATGTWVSVPDASLPELSRQFLRGVGIGIGCVTIGLWLIPLVVGAVLVRSCDALIHPMGHSAPVDLFAFAHKRG